MKTIVKLVLGTAVKPTNINIVFSLVFTPLLFTGCSQYPWPSLARLRWFQVVTAANPMTYASEGLRGTLAPQYPHMPLGVVIAVLAAVDVALIGLGLRQFYRKAIS